MMILLTFNTVIKIILLLHMGFGGHLHELSLQKGRYTRFQEVWIMTKLMVVNFCGASMELVLTFSGKSGKLKTVAIKMIKIISACGLVEIFWRGKHDFHSTMLSNSPENATRWGTSVQLTQRGVNAVAKYWELGNFERVCTPQERIQTAYKRVRDIKYISFIFIDSVSYVRQRRVKCKVKKRLLRHERTRPKLPWWNKWGPQPHGSQV